MTIKTVLLASAVALTPVAAQAQWEKHVQIDPITQKTIWAGITSPMTFANEPRLYPFDLVPGGLALVCAGAVIFGLNGERLFGDFGSRIEFSDLDELQIRARVDDRVAEFKAYNSRDADLPGLLFPGADNDSLYSAIVNAGKLLLEIPTVEYGEVYFSFDLAGTRVLHDRTCGPEQAE